MTIHVFQYDCFIYIQNNLDLPYHRVPLLASLTLNLKISLLLNHLLLIFKYYVFKTTSNKDLGFLQLKTDIIKVKFFEDLSNRDNNKSKKYLEKRQKISDIFVK